MSFDTLQDDLKKAGFISKLDAHTIVYMIPGGNSKTDKYRKLIDYRSVTVPTQGGQGGCLMETNEGDRWLVIHGIIKQSSNISAVIYVGKYQALVTDNTIYVVHPLTSYNWHKLVGNV